MLEMTDASMRAADTDRDRTVERLRDAAAEGRLTFEELADRIGAAGADLPQRESPRPAARERPQLTPFLATSVLLVAIWALTGMGYFWPVWPILGWGVFVVPGALHGGRVKACRRSA